jgi:DNA-binding NarL/FixJ family response regulator
MSLEQLRDFAVRADAANGTGRDPADAALAWRALIDGRYTVVDEFESRGRRYVVVRRPRASAAKLTSREREVLEHAAAGRAGKRIAYDLGISQSTVALHLKSAARKLGYRSRVALVLAVAVARSSRVHEGPP